MLKQDFHAFSFKKQYMQDDSSEDEQDEVDILNDHFDAYDQILNTD